MARGKQGSGEQQEPQQEQEPQQQLQLLVTFLDSVDGAKRLSEAAPLRNDLVRDFCKKLRPMSCGVASMSLVMRSTAADVARAGAQPEEFAEDRLYSRVESVKPLAEIDQGGMTLDEVAACFRRILAPAARSVASRRPQSPDELRDWALAALADPAGAAVANFYLPTLGFDHFCGHLSPLAGYHQASDSLLIMDNDPKPNDPCWVTVQDLFTAMLPVDSDSGLSRGLVVVQF